MLSASLTLATGAHVGLGLQLAGPPEEVERMYAFCSLEAADAMLWKTRWLRAECMGGFEYDSNDILAWEAVNHTYAKTQCLCRAEYTKGDTGTRTILLCWLLFLSIEIEVHFFSSPRNETVCKFFWQISAINILAFAGRARVSF